MTLKKNLSLLASGTLTALFAATLSYGCSSDSGDDDTTAGGAGLPAAGAPAAGTPGAGGSTAGAPAGGTSAGGTTGGTSAAGTSAGGTPAAGSGGTPAAGSGGTPAAGSGGTPAAGSAGTGTGGVNAACTGIRSNMACAVEGTSCPGNACGIADVGVRTCNCTGGIWACESCNLTGAPPEVVMPPASALAPCDAAVIAAEGEACTPAAMRGARCQAPATTRPQICVCWNPAAAPEWDCDNQPWP